MERKLITSPTFRKKFVAICDYIGQEFGNNAVLHFVDKVEVSFKMLLNHPEIGRPMVHRKNVRSIIIKPYNRIFYKIFPSRITLLDIIDMRGDPINNPFI